MLCFHTREIWCYLYVLSRIKRQKCLHQSFHTAVQSSWLQSKSLRQPDVAQSLCLQIFSSKPARWVHHHSKLHSNTNQQWRGQLPLLHLGKVRQLSAAPAAQLTCLLSAQVWLRVSAWGLLEMGGKEGTEMMQCVWWEGTCVHSLFHGGVVWAGRAFVCGVCGGKPHFLPFLPGSVA